MAGIILPYRDILPKIAPSAFIAPTATVIGDVEIGEDAGIWFGCIIRGDVNIIRIGARTNIQDGTIVHVMRDTHPTTLGDEVTVGHAAVLHGCTLHDRVLVGMGAVILNGAVVESDSIIAAGALVVEGARIPARSLVMGRPAAVKRALTDQEVASIRDYAARYVKYRLDYVDEPAGRP